MNLQSKLPEVGTNIFTIMSALANEHKAINLSQGFPNFDCSSKLQTLVNQAMQQGHNQYAPMAGLPILRNSIARKVDLLYQNKINTDTDITITAGATQAIFTAITAFVHQGDEVILIEPAYDCYKPAIELCGATPVCYELEAPHYKVNWDKFQTLITSKTRLIIFNTPHNPTGTIWEAGDLLALETLTNNTDIIVLSDEVYEHIIFDNKKHESVLAYPSLYQRSIAVYSFGKTFHNTGWKMGYAIAPPYLMKEFRKVHQFNVFSCNTPVQYGLGEFMQDPKEYLGLSTFYQQKRDFFLKSIENSRFKMKPSGGTYFQLVDYSNISQASDIEFAKQLTTQYGVAAIPISVFYSNGRDDKMVRLCFAKNTDTLEAAGKLLSRI